MSNPLTHDQAVELGRRGVHSRWAGTTAEQRRVETAAARRALAIKELVDQAPALTDDQRNRLRVILTQAPSGGGPA